MKKFLYFLTLFVLMISNNLFAQIAPTDTNLKRTVVYMYGQTVPGQDMFIRGGLDFDQAKKLTGKDCTLDKWLCAIPITQLGKFATEPTRSNDHFLDWYGAEASQGNVQGSPLAWTTDIWPATWGAKKTVSLDGYGEDGENAWGQHYWKLDVMMDCSKTINSWFELKSFISNGPGWESNIAQPGAPYKSNNHFAQCGKINTFKRGDNNPVVIKDFAAVETAKVKFVSFQTIYQNGQLKDVPLNTGVMIYVDGPDAHCGCEPTFRSDADGTFTADVAKGQHTAQFGYMFFSHGFAASNIVNFNLQSDMTVNISVLPYDTVINAFANPGPGNALYVAGETSLLGNWGVATKMTFDGSKWTFKTPLPQGLEYKIIKAPWVTGDQPISTNATGVVWQKGGNNIITGTIQELPNNVTPVF